MAKIVKDQFGKFVAVKEDGTRVPVSPSFVAESEILPKQTPMTPGQKIAQQAGLSPEGAPSPSGETPMVMRPGEQGASFGERFTLKNVANPAHVQQHLEDWGYEVRPYGNHSVKMQFAIRPKGTSGVWRPLDPDGFDWQDFTDLIGDIPGFVTTSLAAMAAVPAAAAAGLASGGAGALAVESGAMGLGAAAGEAIRQGTGVVSGVEPKLDPGQITTAGVAGAAVPVAAKLVAPVIRAAGRPLAYGFEKVGGVVRNAALRLMGAKAVAGMDVAAADRVLRAAGKKPVQNFSELARAVQTKVQALLKADWPEAAQANDLLAAGRDAGAKVNFHPIIEAIQDAAGAVERRAAGAARPVLSEGESLAARAGGIARTAERRAEGAARPTISEAEAAPMRRGFGTETPAFEAKTGRVAPGETPGHGDFERRMRARQKGAPVTEEEMAGMRARMAQEDELNKGVRTMRNEGAGLTPEQKRVRIAEHEEEFGKPGAFGDPKQIPSEKLTGEAARAEFRNKGLRKELQSFADNLVARLDAQGFRLSEVPVDFANVVKQDLQALARRGGAYRDKPIEEAFIKVMADAGQRTREAMINAMPTELQKDFVDVMSKFEGKTKFAGAVLRKVSDPAATEAWLREVYGDSNASGLRYLSQLEDHFGVKLLPDVAEAQAKDIISKGNLANFAEKHPYMAAAAIFHPQTALPAVLGLGAGPAVGKGLGAAGRGLAKGTEAAAEGAARAANSPVARAAAVEILQNHAKQSGKGIASENQASVSASRKRVTKLF